MKAFMDLPRASEGVPEKSEPGAPPADQVRLKPRIYKHDAANLGPTPGCPACAAAIRGEKVQGHHHHTEECRRRMEEY